jgi:hypothetical protein
MTGFPHSLKQKEPNRNFDLVLIQRLGNFKKSLERSLPARKSIGDRYQRLRMNMYTNDYLKQVQDEVKDKDIFKGLDAQPRVKGTVKYPAIRDIFQTAIFESEFYQQVKHRLLIESKERDAETQLAL